MWIRGAHLCQIARELSTGTRENLPGGHPALLKGISAQLRRGVMIEDFFIDGMLTDRLQHVKQTFDILWGIALMLLEHKRFDLRPGDTAEFLCPKRGQEMVTHNASHDACGREFACHSDVLRQPLLGIVGKYDRLGSCVQ